MDTKNTSPQSIRWETPHYLEGLEDGKYQVTCCLEMEPPIQDPIYSSPSTNVEVKGGWINLTDAAGAVAEAVCEKGGKYDTIVGVAFVRGKVQFVVLWEHTSPSVSIDGRAN